MGMDRLSRFLRGAGLVTQGLSGRNIMPRVDAAVAGLGLVREAMRQGERSAPEGRLLPVRTIADRVAIIAGNMRAGSRHPPIVSLARQLVSQRCGDGWCIRPRDELGMIQVIHAYACDWVRWVKDPVGIDWYAHPRHTLNDRAGDCDEKVAVEGALLGAVGIPVNLVVGQEVGATSWSHIWDEALPDGLEPIPLDPSEDEQPAGWELPPERLMARRSFPIW